MKRLWMCMVMLSVLVCSLFVCAEEVEEAEFTTQGYDVSDSDYFKIKARMICGEERKIINKIGHLYCMPRPDRPVTLIIEDKRIDEKFVEYEYVKSRLMLFLLNRDHMWRVFPNGLRRDRICRWRKRRDLSTM